MTFRTRLDILSSGQKMLWPHLAPLKGLGYCLYGGTALALRYGHRPSVDFDFFSDLPLDRRLLADSVPWLATATTLQADPTTLVALATPPRSKREVKVSFFAGLSLGRVGAPEPTGDGVVLLASPRDLLATKLKALFDRVEPKDYIDIAAMIEHGESLGQGLADARTIFGPLFSPAECLRILAWYGEPGLAALPEGCRQTLTRSVRATWGQPLPPSRKAGRRLVPKR